MTASDKPSQTLGEKIDTAIKHLNLLKDILATPYPNEQRLKQFLYPPEVWDEILTALEALPYIEGEASEKDKAVAATRRLREHMTRCGQLIGQLRSRHSEAGLLTARNACQQALDQAAILKQAAARISGIYPIANADRAAESNQSAPFVAEELMPHERQGAAEDTAAKSALTETSGVAITPSDPPVKPPLESNPPGQGTPMPPKDDAVLNLEWKQLLQLQDALIKAFPTIGGLQRMISYHLGEEPGVVVSGDNLESAVYNLLLWGRSASRLQDIIRAARNANNTNEELRSFARSVGLE